jgi:hypothetical protein
MHRFVLRFSQSQRFLTLCFYILIAGFWMFLLSANMVTHVQRALMKKMHLKTESFVLWSVLQAVPSMYNFSNELWISADPNTLPGFSDNKMTHLWVNHYPLREITFTLYRDQLFLNYNKPLYIYLQSTYRGADEKSAYRLSWDDPQKRSHRVLSLIK